MPDGTIVFAGRKDNYRQLWSMAADGSGRKPITSGNGWAFNLRRLPGGRGMVYTQWSDNEDRPHVWRVDLDGGNQRKVTDGGGEFLIDVSPDGQSILYTEPGSVSIWRVGIEGGEPERMYDDTGRGAFSPDGRFLYTIVFDEVGGRTRNRFRIHRAEGGDPVATFLPPGSADEFEFLPDGSAIVYSVAKEGVGNLWLQPSDGGEPRQLTRFDRGLIDELVVSPDGARIALVRNPDGVENLWSVAVNDGAPTQLSQFPTGVIFDLEWSRDSANVLFTQGEIRREIVLIVDE
jgi:Tol biopolymer transport system component